MDKNTKLFFLRDNTMASGNQVYSGHSGTGKKFDMFMSDYGKYAMKPTSYEDCETLIKKIEKARQGNLKTPIEPGYFVWEIIPMTEISLCNFYEDSNWNAEAYNVLKKEQLELTNG